MKLLITSALLILAVSPLAQAEHKRSYHDNGNHSHDTFKAKVIKSTPVYKYLTVSQPQTYCEPVAVRKGHYRTDDNGAAIVGGIVGGLVGHAASDNKHKRLGTIVGAVIGSSLMHNIDRANEKYSHTVKPQNCVVTHKKAQKVRVLDGYNVTYRAQGKIYRTFRQDKPAKFIRIYY